MVPSFTVRVTVLLPVAVYLREAVAPVPVVPSPKFQAYVSELLSGSEEPVASKLHFIRVQSEVKEATGARLAVATPGLMTTENSWVPPAEALVLATRPAAVPVATVPLESASRELTLPLPVAAGVARLELLVGAVQVWVVEDFSLQELTSQEPACATATVGEVWVVVEVVPAVCSEAVTVGLPPVLR